MINQKIEKDTTESNARLKLLLDVIKPSSLGITIYVVVFLTTLVASQPSQYKTALQNFHISNLQGTFIYSYIKDFINIINTQLANTIVVYVFWALVGLVVYGIASHLSENVSELARDLKLRDYIWPRGSDKNGPLKQFIEKLLFRLTIAALLIIYIMKIGPLLGAMWRNTDLTLRFSMHSIFTVVMLFLIEAIFLHVGVVLVRLLLLRRRVVGS